LFYGLHTKKFATHNWFHRNFGRFFTIFNTALFLASAALLWYKNIADKMKSTHQIGMIRHSNRRYFFALPLYQCRNTNGRLQHRKLRVIVQMKGVSISPFIQKVLL
jgi:hypothetical protein